jgi:hypothetical protein
VKIWNATLLFYISTSISDYISLEKREDERNCFLLQISFYPVYSDAEIPNSCFKKLPRIVNGIPLGAGMLVNEQIGNIRWKYVEGGKKMHTFISKPICEEEAEESISGKLKLYKLSIIN